MCKKPLQIQVGNSRRTIIIDRQQIYQLFNYQVLSVDDYCRLLSIIVERYCSRTGLKHTFKSEEMVTYHLTNLSNCIQCGFTGRPVII